MATAHSTCNISDDIKTLFKKFKVSKNSANSALILKIDKTKLAVELEKQMDNTPINEVASELPETAPRYIVYSYKYTHKDGRASFPLVFLYYTPPSSTQLSMLYASTKQRLVQELGVSKDFEVRDAGELTEAWLKQKLGLFD